MCGFSISTKSTQAASSLVSDRVQLQTILIDTLLHVLIKSRREPVKRSMASNPGTCRRLLLTTSLLSLLFARSLQDDFLFLSEPPRWIYTYNASIAIISCEAFRVDSESNQRAVDPRLFRNSVQLDQYDMPPNHLALASDDGVVIGIAVNPTTFNDSGSTYHCALPNNGRSSVQTTLYVGDGRPFATTLQFTDQHLYSVDLMWDQAPSPPDAPILGYIITVRGPNEPELNVTIETNVTTAELLRLQPGTGYLVSIIAKNAFGYGKRSQETAVSTLQPIVPSPPTDVRAALQLTNDSSFIIVTWMLSEIDPEVMTPVEQYVIFYRAGSGLLHNTSTTDSTTRTLTLTNLPVGNYTIGVAAVNSAGLSPITYTSDAIVVCIRLDPPENGFITITATTAEYSCRTGHTLVGNSERVCQSNGTWSGSDPKCELVYCPSLGSPENGQAITELGFGSRAEYSCSEGYALVGNGERVCQSDGTWSGSDPECELIRCRRLGSPGNGRVDLTGLMVGSRAEYTCREGFRLRGNGQRVCQDNGRWLGSEPVCELLSAADEDSQYSAVLIAVIIVFITLLITIITIIVIIMVVIRRRMKGLKEADITDGSQGSPSIKKKKHRKMNVNTRSDNSSASTIGSSDIPLHPTPEDPAFLTSQNLEITIEEPSTSTFH